MLLDVKISHLGLIQSIINRLGLNSFLIKGWTVTITVAMFAFPVKKSLAGVVVLSMLPVFVFWWLDAYFLHQERLYRQLYYDVAGREEPITTFNLKTDHISGPRLRFIDAALSKTLRNFYGAMLVALVVLRFVFLA